MNKKFTITVKDNETGEVKTIELDGYLLGRLVKDSSGEIDYDFETEGANMGDLSFLLKMVDTDLTARMMRDMGFI